MSGFVDRTERIAARDIVEPRGRLRTAEPPSPSEEQIHRAIVLLLARCAHAGVFWFHVPNGEKRGPGIGGKLKGMGTRAGMPDLFVIGRGRFGALEVKRPGGRLSASQRMTHAVLVACGVEVRTVYSLDEAREALSDWGMIR